MLSDSHFPVITLDETERSKLSYLEAAWKTTNLRERARKILGKSPQSAETYPTLTLVESGSPENEDKNRYGFSCFDNTAVFDENVWLNANSILDPRGHRIVATQASLFDQAGSNC